MQIVQAAIGAVALDTAMAKGDNDLMNLGKQVSLYPVVNLNTDSNQVFSYGFVPHLYTIHSDMSHSRTRVSVLARQKQ